MLDPAAPLSDSLDVWRDISTGPLRILECVWWLANEKRLTIVEYDPNGSPWNLVGPPLTDFVALMLRFDVRRFDEGRGCLHHDPDGPDESLKSALAEMHQRLAVA